MAVNVKALKKFVLQTQYLHDLHTERGLEIII